MYVCSLAYAGFMSCLNLKSSVKYAEFRVWADADAVVAAMARIYNVLNIVFIVVD